MGEKALRSKTSFVHDYGELIRMTEDSTITINSILPLGDDSLQINYTPIEDTEDSSPTTSVIHAAYTTAHGRIMLYEKCLEQLETRALYHDTGT
jgi:hypothetical protein